MEILPIKLQKIQTKQIDNWLLKEGLFRKDSPRDSSCLFRAVSEQFYDNQHEHIRVRRECIDYMKKNPQLFENNITISVDDYLCQMACYTERGGMNEIVAMSKMYNRDFLIFEFPKCVKINVTQNGFKSNIRLCRYGPQFDSVFTIEFISGTAFCQSIVYETLYKNIFHVIDVDSEVPKVLQCGNEKEHPKKYDYESNESNAMTLALYQVAKALDPHTYQNMYLDMFHKLKREARNAGIMKDIRDFQVGSNCLIQLDHEEGSVSANQADKKEPIFYHGIIQAMEENGGPVEVYITDLVLKKTVPYAALKPLEMKPRSHPWNQNQGQWKNRSNGNYQQNGRGRRQWAMPRKGKSLGQNFNVIQDARQDNNNNENLGDEQQQEKMKKIGDVSTSEGRKDGPENLKLMQQVDKEPDKKTIETPKNQSPPMIKVIQKEKEQENGDNLEKDQKSQLDQTEKTNVIEELVREQVSKSTDNGIDLLCLDPGVLKFFVDLGIQHCQNKLAQHSGLQDESTPNQQQVVPEGALRPNPQEIINNVAAILRENLVIADRARDEKSPSPKKANDELKASPNSQKSIQQAIKKYPKPPYSQNFQGNDNAYGFGKSPRNDRGFEQRDNFQNMQGNLNKFTPRFQRNYGGPRNSNGLQRYPKPENLQQNYYSRSYNNNNRVARSDSQQPNVVERGDNGGMHIQHQPNVQQFPAFVPCPPPFNQQPMFAPMPIYNHENGEMYQNQMYPMPHPNMVPPPHYPQNMGEVVPPPPSFICLESPPGYPVFPPMGSTFSQIYNCPMGDVVAPPVSVSPFNTTVVPSSVNQAGTNPPTPMQPNNRR